MYLKRGVPRVLLANRRIDPSGLPSFQRKEGSADGDVLLKHDQRKKLAY